MIGDIPQVPLKIRRGDTFRKVLTIRSKVTKVAIDLTGWTFAAKVRQTHDAVTPLVTFTVTIVDAVAGKIQILIPSATTAALALTTGIRLPVWDLEATKSDGDVWTMLEGKVTIAGDATR